MAKGSDAGKAATGKAAGPATAAPPFSRPFMVDELLRRPDEQVNVSAEPDELAALARADGVPGISSLQAGFKVNRQGKDIRVTGEVRARVTQECVVTLEPFETEVAEPVDVRFAFAPAPPKPEPRGGARISRRRLTQVEQERQSSPAPEFPAHEEDDPPDPIIDGKIDLGALAAEFMALGLDPYPRRPGAAFAPVEEVSEADESPFARLARLKKDE